jgi:hypothetical protein
MEGSLEEGNEGHRHHRGRSEGGDLPPNKATWSVASQVIPFDCANCARHSFVCDGCPVE